MYYIVYGFLWLVSLLPLRVLYILADGIYGLVFYVFKYRRDVVMKNLSLAFPEKTEEERRKIAKKFYRNLIDTFIESIKMVSASWQKLAKRVSFNSEVVNDIYPTGRSIQVHLGHNFNWEWANSVFAKKTPYTYLGVYMPITNKIFDRLFIKLRSRTGTILLPATNMRESFYPYRNTQYLLGLAADQNPGHPGNAWWFNFFGRPTPFVKGPAKGAVLNNTVVVFAFIHKPRRGYYDVVFSLADENPGNDSEVALTGKFVRYLEGVVREYPEMWLWSHRRWKWEWKAEYGEVNNVKF
jgi:Kdo2-lipid IVA lauroyltransferase/acyltransferase